MPLYGHEMNDSISPLETGLDFAVKMDKPDFVGKAAMLQRGTPAITRVGLKATGRGILREHQSVTVNGIKIGETTSGTHCPYLNGAYAMALIDKKFASVGATVEVEVRDRLVPAEIVPLPFYKKS
jgi:aminomethyltransferase